MKVLSKSVSNAKKLIFAGDVDLKSEWEFTSADGNKLLGEEGDDWANYALWHLAEDPDVEENTKARYKYPYGKNGKVYRRGVIAAKSRAAQQGEDVVANAANSLLQAINEEYGLDEDEDACSIPNKKKRKSELAEEEIEEKPKKKIKEGEKLDASSPSNSVQRYDTVGLPDWMTKRFVRTVEGYLKGRAVVTNVGVFPYEDAMGKIRWELRLPEEVFAYDSLESLKLKPVTNDHPSEAVTSENVKRYSVGNLGDNPSSETQRYFGGGYTPETELTDGFHVAIDLIVMDKKTIEEVLNGKDELSCGYTCDLEIAEPGSVWCGVPYDFIQRKIRYNHVAIVDRARAGDAAKIRLDSAIAAVQVHSPKEEPSMNTKKLVLDGVEYTVDEAVANAYSKVEAMLANVNKDKSILEAERDTYKERSDSLNKELEKVKMDALDETKLERAVQERLQIRETARMAGIENIDQSDGELKRAIILKAFPSAKLEGKDESYIQARFDAALDMLDLLKDADSAVREVLFSQNKNDRQELPPDSEEARQRMIASYRNPKRESNED